MDIVGITGMCIISTVICKLFEKNHKEYTFLIAIATTCFVLFMTMKYVSPVIESAKLVFSTAGISTDYLKIIFKAIGICYVTQLGSDYCKDAGESAFATQLELAGKLAILITSLPLFSALLEIIEKLLKV